MFIIRIYGMKQYSLTALNPHQERLFFCKS
nr:MAG TPA: hypothetical protein [Caudoviricetes sp.]